MRVVLDVRVLRGTGGGPEKTLARSASYLRHYDYHMVCAYLCDPTDIQAQHRLEEMRKQGVEIIVIPDCGPGDVGVLRRLIRIIESVRPHIYHGHDYKSHILGALVTAPAMMVRVGTLHGWVDQNAKLSFFYWCEKHCLRLYERVYCVSPELYSQALRSRISQRVLRYLPNGIETTTYKRMRSPPLARKVLGLDAGGIWLGAVARLASEKNLSAVLQTAARLWEQGYPVYCLLVGDGPLRSRLEHEARSLRLSERVHFAGYQNDVRPWLECMDIYLCTSVREGMPNSVLEAMAMEVPVVATRVGGIPHLIRHKEEGLLVPCGDILAITEAVRQIVEDPITRDRLVRSARARVAREFSLEKRIQLLATDYDRLLSRTNNWQSLREYTHALHTCI